eukprot:GHRR01003483.1.p1 GENE.GHRR01003483.1~~GHRR01003483.1.p1  ORF type:complete len:221 (-),score=44.30 GHRR01003483.1:5067-5729(-)
MAFAHSTRNGQFATQRSAASRASCPSRPARKLICRAVFNLHDGSSKFAQRDVITKATVDEAAVPLPEPRATSVPLPTFLDALVEATVRVPYSAYATALKERPLFTKACTSLVGFMLGDVIAQQLSHPESLDLLRALRLGMYGLLIDGPIGSNWYDILEQYVFPKEPVSTKAVLAKTALDQVVYASIMTGGCSRTARKAVDMPASSGSDYAGRIAATVCLQ